MAKDKKSFILYADQLEHFEDLTDEEAGQLIKHVFRYVNDKNPEAPNRIIQVAFNPVKQQLKRDLKTYECTKDERSKAGILGNLKKYNLDLFEKVVAEKLTIDEAQSIAKTRKASQSDKVVANLAVNVNVNDNVNDIFFKKETKEILTIPENLKSIWDLWLEYRKAKKIKNYAGAKFEKMAIDKLIKFSDGNPITAKKIIDESITNSWTGFFELKNLNNNNQIKDQNNETVRQMSTAVRNHNPSINY
jgi:hypothetical protein